MIETQSIVVRQVGATPAADALSQTASIQNLIDNTKNSTASAADADNAQTALTGIIGDLQTIDSAPAPTGLSARQCAVLGFGAGITVTAIVYLMLEHADRPRRRSPSHIRRRSHA